jgi:hypothetical protein
MVGYILVGILIVVTILLSYFMYKREDYGALTQLSLSSGVMPEKVSKRFYKSDFNMYKYKK